MEEEQQGQPIQETQQPNLPPPAAPAEKVGPEYWKKPKRSKLIYIIIILILLIGSGVYWFLLKPEPAAKTAQTRTALTVKPETRIASSTTHYDSSSFSLGFDYPKGWTVTDTAGSGKLTVVSGPLQLKDANGQQVNGLIVMTIRDRTQKLTEFDKGAATATRDSEKIAYTKPTQTQRGSTYISFLQYATSPGGGSLDGIYITGDNGYQKDQDIPLVDVAKADPVVSITFLKCADAKCAGTRTALSVQDSIWDDNSFSKPLKNMLESLSIN